ncbi:MAG: L-2-hydroxyglutarate oxidase [Candidatus Eremiobacteraeota bacterium]|nr:L-2-hydroxyglutarate oxidase [Candidatus Eremiobacteraeota bacterium]
MVYDVAVVGGGIVGLATTRELLLRHPSLRIANVEKEDVWSVHQTGHNSGVIHSGIYYKPGSLKARLCTQGRKLLWEYCEAKRIPYRGVGKLIVATDESELGRLQDLYERGIQNGIDGLEILDAKAIAQREPHCRGIKAIFSPVTGIVDYGVVARSYADDASEFGADMFLGHEVTAIERRGDVRVLRTPKGEVHAKRVITCGGLRSDVLAQMTGGDRDPKIVPFRGDYLILKPEKSYLVKGNIYPVPDPEFPFLGVHFTPRMDGSIWLGPNAVPAFSREGYTFFTVDAKQVWDMATYPGVYKLLMKYWKVEAGEVYRDLIRSAYVEALQRYIPELTVDDTLPGPSGVRAQAMTADGGMVDDFVFEGTDGVVHVRNAPSPAATSSLAIGKYIADDAEQRFDLSSRTIAV